MKQFLFPLLFALFLISCGNSNKEEAVSNVEESSEMVLSDEGESKKIPIYSYDELESHFLGSKNNGILILNFWATWCKPCVKELPAFEQVYAKYKDKGVKVVLVSLDFPEHVNKAVLPFIEKNKLKSEVVLLDDLDANAWIPKVSPEWSGAIPATLVIKDGERHFYEQSFTYESLENEIQSLL